MGWLRTVWAEFFGLFVDDGNLAVAMLLWLGLCGLLLPQLRLPFALPPAILFVGLLLILAESVVRRASRRH